jgi:ABC-2 type transport system permease protein
VYLSIGQALVGLVKSADTVNAAGRVLYIALIVLGTLGLAGTLGSVWESITRWTPVGTVMTLFAGVLNLTAWSARDTLSLVVSVAYIVVFAGFGIRWFQWDAR